MTSTSSAPVALVLGASEEGSMGAVTAARFARDGYGRLDCAVNRVGQAVMDDIANTSEDQLRRGIDYHLVGTFFSFIHMASAIDRDGAMVTISSLTGGGVINNPAACVTDENVQVKGGHALTGLPGNSVFVALMKWRQK